MNGLYREAHFFRQLRDLVAGVCGIAAAVIEEVTDVVRLEDLDQALVFGAVLFEALELEAGRTEGAAGRMPESGNGACRFLVGVDHVFGQRADDAVAPGIDVGDLVFVFAGRFDHAAGAGIDHRGHAARLGVESIFPGSHGNLSLLKSAPHVA